MASSPHGLVFLPHTSPLDTENKDNDLSPFASRRTAGLFPLMCRDRPNPPSSAEGTAARSHIHYHKYQNIRPKMSRLREQRADPWHLFISPHWRFDVCSSQLTPHLRALQSCSSEPPSPQSLKRSHCSCIGMQRWLLQVNSVFPQGRDLRVTVSACVHTVSPQKKPPHAQNRCNCV